MRLKYILWPQTDFYAEEEGKMALLIVKVADP